MKSSVTITLIICGTLLVTAPYIHNSIATQQLTNTMVALGKTVNLTADVPRYANVVAMLCGFVMILFGVIAGLQKTK